ncbi:hypothetical protein [Moritella viscosa]|uniref:hypothetical protein n=1 Tax=Moritella viscosa TaxID=80854 RepID=UPI0009215018|nr:hypothetical protein [Moritella viscosa]SGZ09212.1 Putative uncharacterized protein [Moritella viscosa]
MPIDWTSFGKEIDTAIGNSVKETDDALASKVSSLTRLTDEEVKALFPERKELKQLSALMSIVQSSTSHNDKINSIVASSEEFAGITVKLLKKLL